MQENVIHCFIHGNDLIRVIDDNGKIIVDFTSIPRLEPDDVIYVGDEIPTDSEIITEFESRFFLK